MTFVDRTIVPETAPQAGREMPMPAAGVIGFEAPELASLLSVLFRQVDEAGPLVLNVVSPHPGAGTSTVARRLAAAAASTGWCGTALLEARPAPGMAGSGLVESVERGERPVLRRASVGPFTVGTGRLSTGGGPLCRLDSVRKLYGILRQRYALVVVDCPAVFASQQTLAVAPAADETVLVVEAERSGFTEIARARDALERHGAGVLGLVMNKSRGRVSANSGVPS